MQKWGVDHQQRDGAMFGRGATDRVVLERAWILESQLSKLAPAGTAAPARNLQSYLWTWTASR